MLSEATVVMGAGGPWGVAWMTGLLFGLEEKGVEVRHPGSMIGSSAGAILGARLGTGLPLHAFYELEISLQEQTRQAARLRELLSSRPAATTDRASAGAASLLDVLSRDWNSEEERVQALCQLAIKANTVSWDKFEAFGIPPEYRSAAWPDFPLQITVIDVDEGCLATIDASSDVSISLAVLASCAIPGVFPPVPIKGHRYIDGGSWGSGDNTHLAAGAKFTLVISPLAAQHNRNAVILDRDIQSLRSGGTRVHSIVADQASLAARGAGLPDPASLRATAEAGRAQGHKEADELQRKLG
jgi:NTE family protein